MSEPASAGCAASGARKAERSCLSRHPRALPAGLQAGVGRLQAPALSHDFRPIPLGHPSAPVLSTLYHASNLDWRFVSLKGDVL